MIIDRKLTWCPQHSGIASTMLCELVHENKVIKLQSGNVNWPLRRSNKTYEIEPEHNQLAFTGRNQVQLNPLVARQ